MSEKIKEAIRALAAPHQMTVQLATVKSVDKDACTCAVAFVNEDADLDGVRLRAVNDGSNDGLVIYPAVGSFVLIGFIEGKNTAAFVMQTTVIESIVNDGGELGGMVKVQELQKQLQVVQTNFDILKNACDVAFTAVNSVVSGVSVGYEAAIKAMQAIDTTQLENEKIKQ